MATLLPSGAQAPRKAALFGCPLAGCCAWKRVVTKPRLCQSASRAESGVLLTYSASSVCAYFHSSPAGIPPAGGARREVTRIALPSGDQVGRSTMRVVSAEHDGW